MKAKIFSILLCMLLAFTLVFVVACGNKDENGDGGSTNTDTSTDTATDSSTDTSTDTSTDDEQQAVMHRVEFVLGNGEANVVKSIKHGTLVLGVPVNIARPGYTFTGWVANDESWDENSTITADIVITATWTANENVLVFNPNCDDARGEEMAPLTIKTDEKVTLTANTLSRTGYKFKGWATSENGEVAYADGAEYTMGADAQNQLYAVWEAIQYSITYNLDPDVVNPDTNPTYYTVAQVVTLQKPTKEGWVFKGWRLDGAPFIDTEGLIGGIELTAQWERPRYAVTYRYNDLVAGRDISKGTNPIDINCDEVITLADAECTGYKFEGWYIDADLTTPITTLENVNEAVTLYGKFSIVTYEIEYVLPQGVVNAEGNIAEYNVTTEFTFLAPTVNVVGYEFDGWYIDEESKAEGIGAGTTEKITITARLKPIVYKITYVGAEEGFLPEDAITEYTVESAFTTIPLPTVSIPGITFNGWFSDEAYENQITEITLDKANPSDITVYLSAEFTKYTITYVFPEGIDASLITNPNRSWFADAVVVTFEDATVEGYKFLGWYKDASFENVITSTEGLTENITVYASLKKVVTQIGKEQIASVEQTKGTNDKGETIDNWGDVDYMFDGATQCANDHWYDGFNGWAGGKGATLTITLDQEYYITEAILYYWANWKSGSIQFYDAEGNEVARTGKEDNPFINFNCTNGTPMELAKGINVQKIVYTSQTPNPRTITLVELILKVGEAPAVEEAPAE